MNASASRSFYTSIGFEPIPLAWGTKRPISEAWPTKPIAEQWRNAPSDVNLGIRHRGDVINIEADTKKSPATFERITQGLAGMGVTNPVVIKSASVIGRHVYVRCPDAPSDVSYRNLSPEVGAGELRVGIGAMSVLPDSLVGGVIYECIAGDWKNLPVVQWHDMLWLLPMQRVITHTDTLPVRLAWRPESTKVIKLLDAITHAEHGEAVGPYPSRSEAESAIVSALILNGWDFDGIRALFKQQSAGHYKDARRHADKYLQTTYSNALAAIMSSDVRQSLATMYQDAESTPWPGKSGISDRAAYTAVLSEFYRAGAVETSISVREVSEHAALSIETSRCALARLTADRLIERVRQAAQDGKIAAVYRVGVDSLTSVTVKDMSDYRHPSIVTSVRLSPPPELASRRALGPSAVQVYGHLDTFKAQSIKRLAAATGRARSTVAAALARLAEYRLAIQTDAGSWIQGTNDLASVAHELNCSELAAAKRAKHEVQRAAYQRALAERGDRSTHS